MRDKIEMAMMLAFEAGKWAGQVELEEHYDKEQYSSAILEVMHAKKHAMPISKASEGRDVTIRLRSQKWRDGVLNQSDQYLNMAMEMLGIN